MLKGNFAGVALLSYVGVGLQTKAMKVLLRQGFLRLAPLAQDKLLALPCNKKAACAAFLLLRQGSNLDSSDPESDVLPITPRSNFGIAKLRHL